MKQYLASDWIADFLNYKGVKDIFYVSGGGAMFIIDSFGRHTNLNLVSNHHEQASAMCAEAYYRVQRKPGVCLSTTGPAATNIITGVVCAWTDSIPTLFISGQAKSTSLVGDSNVRQRGVHEANICSMLQRSTKLSKLVSSVDLVIPYFTAAWRIMLSNRPGPVHLDIPLDIQSAPFQRFDPSHLNQLESEHKDNGLTLKPHLNEDYSTISEVILQSLKAARYPAVLAGYGVFLSDTIASVDSFCLDKSIPLLSTKNLYGHLSSLNSYHPGHVGTYGLRIANLILQSSDLLLVFGSRLAAPVTGYDVNLFAPFAKIIAIDIDIYELDNLAVDALKFCAPLEKLMPVIVQQSRGCYDYGQNWKEKIYELNELVGEVDCSIHSQEGTYINPYWFIRELIETASEDSIFTYDQGAAYYCSTLSSNLKSGQLMFSNGGFTPMGYGLPAAIGAWYASNGARPVICIHGDGGLQMNVQELQTIRQNNIQIKLFVYSNEGYLSIKNTQDAYFSGRYFGSNPSSGLSCPSFSDVALAYGIMSYRVHDSIDLLRILPDVLSATVPVLVEILTDPHQIIGPRVGSRVNADGSISSSPLHDMTPLLDVKRLHSLFPQP